MKRRQEHECFLHLLDIFVWIVTGYNLFINILK
jgi:hypothetical protein